MGRMSKREAAESVRDMEGFVKAMESYKERRPHVGDVLVIEKPGMRDLLETVTAIDRDKYITVGGVYRWEEITWWYSKEIWAT
jgi:hypothetical protein